MPGVAVKNALGEFILKPFLAYTGIWDLSAVMRIKHRYMKVRASRLNMKNPCGV